VIDGRKCRSMSHEHRATRHAGFGQSEGRLGVTNSVRYREAWPIYLMGASRQVASQRRCYIRPQTKKKLWETPPGKTWTR